MKKIVILGAGPTGLGAAYRLNQLGYQNWAIFEKNNYVGGLSASFQDRQGFTWDVGGHILFSNNNLFNRIVDDLMGNEMLSFTRESWIWLKENFIKYPFQNNFHMHPEKEIVLECIMGLIDTLNRKGPCKNFEQWILQFFGEGIARHFMIPYNEKVWACPLNTMDYDWIAERISIIDIKRIMRNIITQKEDSAWGPNNTFRYPLHGGTGGLFNRFMPFTQGHLSLNKDVMRINTKNREIVFQDGERATYDVLISTMPLNELVHKMDTKPEHIERSLAHFNWSGGYMVGAGINKPCPSKKNWMYFPQDDSPFYRVTYLSNYSPNMTPKGDYFSFLAETSFSNFKNVSNETIVENTVQGLINSKLLKEEDRKSIVSTHVIKIPYSYPIPFSGRDRVLADIQEFLSGQGIYSRGRFGGWKYEVGNMDHSVLQGIEAVEKILLTKEEQIYRT